MMALSFSWSVSKCGKINNSVTPSASLVALFCLRLIHEGPVLKTNWASPALRNAEEGSNLMSVVKICLTTGHFSLPCIQQAL